MPRGYSKITANATDWSVIKLPHMVNHYSIQNKSSVVVLLSHDGVTVVDELDPDSTVFYDEDYQRDFYFKAVTGSAQIKLVWW